MISPEVVRFREACPEKLAALRAQEPSLSPLVAEMLVARGHTTPEQVDRYFHPRPDALHDPFLFKNMDRAVSLLKEALSEGEKILICGDYDCDGICSTTLMMEALQEIGADVSYHVPDRFKEGYGLSMVAVERCQKEGFGLLITVDCGSSNHKEIAAAREAGIKVIVTDHHAVPQPPPEPDAFLNPQQADCPYPFKGICGTGVAFKLVQALRNQSGSDPTHFLDLVALATVADVVPLVDENRVLVQLGLQELGRSRREGLTALLEVAGRTGRDVVDAFTVGFTLGPRLNAAGRMEHAKIGVELVLSRSLSESRQLAAHLDRLNEARKECEREIQEEIEARLQAEPERYERGAIVEWGEGWHQGVIGITAGRLAEKYGVPTLVIAVDGDKAKGSGRSPENVDLYQTLTRCGQHFTRYGGHPRAGGFSLKSENLEPLAKDIVKAAAELRDGPAPVWVDASLTLPQVNIDLVKALERMEPFGEANPRPNFLLEGVEITHQRLVGRTGDHVQLELQQVGQRRRAIAFRQADLLDELRGQEYRYDLRCQLGRDNFRGKEQLKVQVSGVLKPACQGSAVNQEAVVDLRHLRGRRQALDHWLGEQHGLAAICREPDKAGQAYPALAHNFFTYEKGPSEQKGLLLLTPPESIHAIDQLIEHVNPPRLVVLFGCQEVEAALAKLQARSWDRTDAIRVWQLLKRSGEESFEPSKVLALCQQRANLEQQSVMEILEAFQETEALRQNSEGQLQFGQANGQKLETTVAFHRWRQKAEDMRRVRTLFSGPQMKARVLSRWSCLGKPELVNQ